jgi:hypothetical protein
LAGAKTADEPADIGIRLLADVRDILAKTPPERNISTARLLNELTALEGAPWEDFCRGKPLNSRALGRLLHSFGIGPQNISKRLVNGGTAGPQLVL